VFLESCPCTKRALEKGKEDLTKSRFQNQTLARSLCHDQAEIGLLLQDLEWALDCLAPLDSLKHDDWVDPESLPAAGLLGDPLSERLRHATMHAAESLRNLEALLGDLDGIIPARDKNRYEDPVRRAVRGSENILTRITELKNSADLSSCTLVYQIRKNILSGLVAKCDNALARLDTGASVIETCSRCDKNEEHSFIYCEIRVDYVALIVRLRSVRRIFCRLRDNPSQKMIAKLTAAIAELEGIRSAVCALADRAGINYEPQRWQ
jgi:hypothetical protein